MEGIRDFVVRFSKRREVLFIPPIIAFFVHHGLLEADFLNIDDPLLFQHLPELKVADFLSIDGNAAWYRPLLDLTYLFDYKVWNFDPFGFHLTNILLHTINTVLVALLTLTLIREDKITALLASLLFALHPINLECVAWISARADLLSTSAILTAFIAITLYLEESSKRLGCLYLSLVAYFAALLVKETAIVFIPVIISYSFFYRKKRIHVTALRFLSTLLLYLFITGAYFILRANSISGNDISEMIPELYYLHMISPFFNAPDLPTAVFHALIPVFNFIGTLGFYFKKFLFPYPLNMLIDSINEDAYILFSLTVLSTFIAFFRKRRLPIFLGITFFLWLAPAFPIAFTNIAWTHYSERYLYLPGAFLIIGVAYLLKTLQERGGRTKPWVVTLTVVILVQFLSVDIINGKVWKNNTALTRHIIRDNPHRSKPYEIQGLFLVTEGRYGEAEDMLKMAMKLGAEYKTYYYLGLMALKNGEEEEGISLLKKSAIPPGPDIGFYKSMGDYFLDKSENNESGPMEFLNEALKYYKTSYKTKPNDPAILYRLSLVNFKRGNFGSAEKYAKELAELSPDSVRAFAVKKYLK